MFALVFNNKCYDVVEETFPVAEGMEWLEIPQGLNVQHGWDYINGQFIAPSPPPVLIPIITATQMLIVLQAMGFITETEATDRSQFPTAFNALLSGNAEQNKAIKIRWANLTIVERNDPLVGAFAALLSLTNEQIDGMFIQAAAI